MSKWKNIAEMNLNLIINQNNFKKNSIQSMGFINNNYQNNVNSNNVSFNNFPCNFNAKHNYPQNGKNFINVPYENSFQGVIFNNKGSHLCYT